MGNNANRELLENIISPVIGSLSEIPAGVSSHTLQHALRAYCTMAATVSYRL